MTGEVGSPVCGCADGAAHAAATTEGAPVDSAVHRNCRIRLVSVIEHNTPDSAEYIGSGSEIFAKGLDVSGTRLLIRYEVVGCTMDVTLWLELEPGNTVHNSFYRGYEGMGVTGRRVVTIINAESRAPGTHEVQWDMRDKTQHHRLMLAGQYLLKIQGLHDVTRSDQNTVKFALPFSYNHGIHYRKWQGSQWIPQTTKRECEHAADRQQHLLDGTRYSPDASMDTDATIAWGNLRQGAVNVVSGHSSPNLLIFYPKASEPGHPANFHSNLQSAIHQANAASAIAQHADSVDVLREPQDALRDMLLTVLAGCKGGNEARNVQERLKFLHDHLNPRGIDGDHGPRTTAALATYQDWEGLTPADGTQNAQTLARLGVVADANPAVQTRAVQTRLRELSRRYNPGPLDNQWGDDTERALAHWQEDHQPALEVNSLPDEPTLRSLRLDGEDGHASLNMADLFRDRGCNLVLGFVKSVSFRAAETWHMHFWDLAAQGVGVQDACSQARNLCPAHMQGELEYSLYNRSDVDRNQPLHPARHGADI